jgi:hypothetical protein
MVATYLFYLGTKQVTVPACIYNILSTVDCGPLSQTMSGNVLTSYCLWIAVLAHDRMILTVKSFSADVLLPH